MAVVALHAVGCCRLQKSTLTIQHNSCKLVDKFVGVPKRVTHSLRGNIFETMGFVHHADSSAPFMTVVASSFPLLLAFAICLFIVLITHVSV